MKKLISIISSFRERNNLFIFLVMAFCIVLVFVPGGFEQTEADTSVRCQGTILSVDNSGVQQFGIVKTGIQGLTVELTSGPFSGEVVDASNQLLGKMDLDTVFTTGDRILVVLDTDEGEIISATAVDHYRINTEVFLLGLFALLLIVFAGKTGSKALLSFVFTALMIWKILLPGFLKGYDPVLLSLAIVAVLTAVIIFLVGGLSRKGTVAFFGSIAGLLLTCGLAVVFCSSLSLHGAVRPFSETLLYSGYPHLDLTRIFLSGIFIASSGAVMDLSMDVSASMNEIIEKKPDISLRELITSGLNVGRAVVGTMVTTLLLAYSSAYTTMLMVFIAQGIPLTNILNLNYVSAEILNTIVGSFGLVTVAPFTALIGGVIYTGWYKERIGYRAFFRNKIQKVRSSSEPLQSPPE